MATNNENLSSKDLLEAQSHLWNHMFSFINSLSLKCAVELGIADAIHNHGEPISLADLSAALSVQPCRIPQFRRLMSFLVHNEFFAETITSESDKEVLYSLTTNSALLVTSKGSSITPLIEVLLDEVILDPWQSLSSWFKSEQPSTAFEMYHGMRFWEATSKKPEFGEKVRAGMSSDSRAVAKVLVQDCGELFHRVKSLVEVAGAIGTIARAIAEAFPQIKCSVLDLPHMIDAVEKSDLVEYVAGDMFEHIPPADVLVLKWVLQTWSDEECVEILKRCKEALPSKVNGGKAIIIDKVLDADTNCEHPKISETQYFFDMQMMVHSTGRQRTEQDWKKLFTAAGFSEYKIIPVMGMRCIIEIYY